MLPVENLIVAALVAGSGLVLSQQLPLTLYWSRALRTVAALAGLLIVVYPFLR